MENNDKNKIIGGIIIGAGGLLAGKAIKDTIDKNYINIFLRYCSDFEKYSKQTFRKKKIQINNNDTFNDILRNIKKYKLLEKNEINNLFEIRDLRNKVVHGDQEVLNKNISDKYCRILKKYIFKLKIQ